MSQRKPKFRKNDNKGESSSRDFSRRKNISRNERIQVRVTGLDENGYGIAVNDSMALRIAGSLPGDVALAVMDYVSQRMAYGHVIKILEPSALRELSPPCGDSVQCLGCPLIIMRYEEQVAWKRQFIQRHMEVYRELGDITIHPLVSPEHSIHYRTTARLAVAGKHSEPFIGMYRRATHDVFDLEECPLHHPLVNRAITAVRNGVRKLKVPIYNPRSGMGLLRYLMVRVSEAERKVMVVLVTAKRSFNELHHLGKFITGQVPEVEVVVQNVNASEGNVILGSVDHFLTPRHHLIERIGDVNLMISPRSFFQVNRDGARLIYEKVRQWASLEKDDTVLDLYCGIGGIALALAGEAGKVLGVEVVESAVEDARRNARLNGITNCDFEAGDVAEFLKEISGRQERVDVVTLNPPRKGCDQQVLRCVAALQPRTLIYVSCSPQSLARDLEQMKRLGYVCTEIQPVDMFPQTMHVESVARLEKKR